MDNDASTAAQLGVVIGALNAGSSTLSVSYPADRANGDIVVLALQTGDLADLLSTVALRFRHPQGNATLVSSDIVGVLDGGTGIAVVKAPQAFNGLDLAITSTASLARTLNVYEVKVLPPLPVAATPDNVHGTACGTCSVTNVAQAHDQNPQTAATLSTPAASAGNAALVFLYPSLRPAGSPFAFDARATPAALSRTSVAFYRAGQLVHTVPGSALFSPTGLRYQRASATSPEPYDEARVQKEPNSSQAENVAVYEGAADGGESLPVELVAFAAVADGSTARLSWATASETNNAGFVVERQRGAAWEEASALIAGHGTTTERHAYTFDVPQLAPGRHAFRLRQIDTDGTTTYSGAVTVEVGSTERLALSAPTPNPARDRATVALDVAVASPVQMGLYDLLGRRVATLFDGQAPVGRTLVPVDLADLPAGVYLVRAQAGETQLVQRVVRTP